MPDHEFAVPGSAASDQKMTNEDFRKLMMTPRASSHGSATPSLGGGSLTPALHSSKKEEKKSEDSGEKGEKRKKKKSYYAKLKRQEDDKMAELAAKYRDRAKERRDGGVSDRPDDSSGGGAYRAVAPDVKGNFDAAERRRQMIQESKYLGGDMEHTHLVKGLDFALLQKVRSEILNREKVEKEKKEQEEIEVEETETESKSSKKSKNTPKEPPKEVVKIDKEESKIMCKSVLAKNIVKTIFNAEIQEKNELFFPGRMAYIVELEEDLTESSTVTDIPTTIIRSKADIQAGNSSQQSLSSSTNDIVINKLTQILSYLRAGKHNKKKKRDKNEMIEKMNQVNTEKKVDKGEDLPIYDDVGDYVPSSSKNRDRNDRDRDRDRHDRDRDRRDRDRDRYRDRDNRDHRRSDYRERDRDRDRKSRFDNGKGSSRYFDRDEREEIRQNTMSGEEKDLLKKLIKREEEKAKREEAKKINAILEPDHYAECYPGMSEMNDAIDDSDEEADYSKMDLGNKKGPIGRWDFDTAEEYADYMSNKEALPKAAFQYGVKMNEGRKTRGKVGAKSEKAKLDKEWNQISALIDKRKNDGGSGGGSMPKIPKFD